MTKSRKSPNTMVPEGGQRIAITASKEELKDLLKLGIDLETDGPKDTLRFAFELLKAIGKQLDKEDRAVTKENMMELVSRL